MISIRLLFPPRPGVAGDLSAERGGWRFTFRVSVVANAVWRRGRVFLTCPLCHGAARGSMALGTTAPLPAGRAGVSPTSPGTTRQGPRAVGSPRVGHAPRHGTVADRERTRARPYAASVDRWAQRRQFLSSSS